MKQVSAETTAEVEDAFRTALGCWVVVCFDCAREEFVERTGPGRPVVGTRCSVCGGRRFIEDVAYGPSPFGSALNAKLPSSVRRWRATSWGQV